MLYKIYVKVDDGQYKLVNYFQVNKNSLAHIGNKNIDFYFSHAKEPDISKTKEALTFVNDFSDKYGIQNKQRITYIVANSIDEAWQVLGVPYTGYRSEKKYAGLIVYPSIILSTRENHIHELVHAILKPTYPKTPKWLNEGIATYYGGAAEKKYTYYVDKLRKYIDNNSNINLFDQDVLNHELENYISVQYSIGAIFVDHIIKEYGYEKMKEILSCTNNDEIFSKLNVEPKAVNAWVHKMIREYK